MSDELPVEDEQPADVAVIISDASGNHGDVLTLNLNAEPLRLPIGKPTLVAAHLVATLRECGLDVEETDPETVATDDQPSSEAASDGGAAGGDGASVAVVPPASEELLAIIHQPISKLKESLPGLTVEELDALHAAEIAEGEGKTRKGALEAIEEAKAALNPNPEQ